VRRRGDTEQLHSLLVFRAGRFDCELQRLPLRLAAAWISFESRADVRESERQDEVPRRLISHRRMTGTSLLAADDLIALPVRGLVHSCSASAAANESPAQDVTNTTHTRRARLCLRFLPLPVRDWPTLVGTVGTVLDQVPSCLPRPHFCLALR